MVWNIFIVPFSMMFMECKYISIFVLTQWNHNKIGRLRLFCIRWILLTKDTRATSNVQTNSHPYHSDFLSLFVCLSKQKAHTKNVRRQKAKLSAQTQKSHRKKWEISNVNIIQPKTSSDNEKIRRWCRSPMCWWCYSEAKKIALRRARNNKFGDHLLSDN